MDQPLNGSTSHIMLGTVSDAQQQQQAYPVGSINFVAQGHVGEPAKYCIVKKDYPVEKFATEFFEAGCKLARPKVLISVTGGAQDFNMLSSKLEQIFSRGLLRAAQNTTAWIVTGGLDSGVMKFVGDAINDIDADVPCIGIATYKKVTNKELLATHSTSTVAYAPEKANDRASAALNPNHTHFLLVDSDADLWGEEIDFRTKLEGYISRAWHVPMVLVAVEGGPGTIKTVVEGVKSNFPTIIVGGSGRASDAMVSYLKHKQSPRNSLIEWNKFLQGINPNEHAKYIEMMEALHANRKYVTIFNPNEDATGDMDLAILRSILTVHADSAFEQKLALGVQWGRSDLIEELLQQDDSALPAQEKLDALNAALQQSLALNRPAIFELLVSKGADKGTIDLNKLYDMHDIQYQINRLIPFAGLISDKQKKLTGDQTPLLGSKRISHKAGIDRAREILNVISPMYVKLLTDNKVTFTDVLVWAILVERYDMAQAVWRQTTLPVHSALVACHLCATLAEWFQGDSIYTEHFEWFQTQASNVLTELDYEPAVEVLEWKWHELKDTDALELAEHADCKEFFSHAYVQRYLDDKFYSDGYGRIPPGTKMWRVVMLLFFPFLISNSGSYTGVVDPNREAEDPPFYCFYTLPVVKLISNTIAYIVFLTLLTANVMLVDPHGDDKYEFHSWEVALWIWIFASLIEELVQFWEDREEYFSLLSNRMDACMYAILVLYFVLRMVTLGMTGDSPARQRMLHAYTDTLIIATIACFLRVMNVFAFSKSLGPLFFVIIRLFKDVAQWMFIFILFMISFQAGFFAFTRQAHSEELPTNPWHFFPGGTMGIAFTAILGDTGDNTMEIMTATRIGVVMLLLYSLITQVMLVNLLIAMMGDTYGAVKENSDKEWKYYRYSLVIDYMTSSTYPPPLNLLFGPILYVYNKIQSRSVRVRLETLSIRASYNGANYTPLAGKDIEGNKTLLKMKLAKEKVLENAADEELDTLHTVSSVVREHMRILNAQRDSDKLYLEHNMQNIMNVLQGLQTKVEAMEKSFKSSSSSSQ